MNKQGGYLVAKALKNEGTECIFTLCGGHIQPIYTGCIETGIRVVDVRHEQAAAHAADGWARITRKPGVAIVTAGPGLTNSVTGIANAMRAGSPIVVIGGQAPLFQFEKRGLQEMDHVGLLKPITKWAKRVHETRRIPEYISAAFRHATAGRPGPVFLEIPLDVLLISENEDSVFFPAGSPSKPKTNGDVALVSQAIDMLRASERPVIMAGASIWWDDAGTALEKLSRMLQAPVYVNGMARGCVSATHPLFFSQTRSKALGEADVIVLVGVELDFRLAFGSSSLFNPSAKIIQINIEPTEIGRNRPVDVGIVGDTRSLAEEFCRELGRPAPTAQREAWLSKLRKAEEQDSIRTLLESEALPIHPARLCHEVDKFLNDEAIIIGDGGDIVSLGARIIRPRGPGQWLDPGPFGCLGMGMPFGLAARLAKPDKQILLLYGDGSFGFNGMEVDTAVRLNLPMVIVIGNDGGWGQMRSGTEMMGLSEEVAGVAVDLGFTHYEKMVEALGGVGIYVEHPSEIRPALERAFECGRPACINVKIDPQGARQMLSASRGMTT
jgi:acetolactate synthase-1/2/3 large subunit